MQEFLARDASGRTLRIALPEPPGDGETTVEIDGAPVACRFLRMDHRKEGWHYILLLDHRPRHVILKRSGENFTVHALGEDLALSVVDRRLHDLRGATAAAGGRGARETVKSPMPGKVVRVHAGVGDLVAPGGPVVTLEAMKMEMDLVCVCGGRVAEMRVKPGDGVAGGVALAAIEPA